MKVLWVLNLMPPALGEQLGKECSVKEGWISGLLGKLVEEEAAKEITLGICYPVTAKEEEKREEIRLSNENIICYGFCEDSIRSELYEEKVLMERFQEIFTDFEPELLHVFGTEYGHTLAAVKAFGRPKRTLIGLQGIISACAKEYLADLPGQVYRKNSFRDWLKQDGMLKQQEKFAIRGEREKAALIYTGNVTGRTDFDRKAVEKLNEHVCYFFMNETLRPEFYSGSWSRKSCIPHRIFFSQADYPLKGFHYLLQSMPVVKRSFPDVTIAVAGNSLVKEETLKDRIKLSAYGKYLKQLIREAGMEERVTFLGKLSAEEMKEEYLKCQTFVCASSLENSPNSLGEAMCLGVPVVASGTGGIPSMLEDGKEGLLFPKGNVKALGRTLVRLWKDPSLEDELSRQGAVRAKRTHDGEKNFSRLLEIYQEICKEGDLGKGREGS
ncbi:MAG: glycosyltransferase family 4 protein [Lachnospiraceae bacterium]|nr:glycosyltransferase family 4 protein [Lachnospiraceae bacterium]